MDFMADDTKNTPAAIAVMLAVVLILVVGTVHLMRTDQPQQGNKNRVPVQMINGQDLIDLQQTVKSEQETHKQLQAQIDQLKAQAQPAVAPKAAYMCQEPNLRCGPNEQTNPGIVTDFGAYDLLTESQSSDVYTGFNFTDRTGFSKRFYPVCPGQTVQTGVPITIMYHWKNWTGDLAGKRGCFVIDGFQKN